MFIVPKLLLHCGRSLIFALALCLVADVNVGLARTSQDLIALDLDEGLISSQVLNDDWLTPELDRVDEVDSSLAQVPGEVTDGEAESSEINTHDISPDGADLQDVTLEDVTLEDEVGQGTIAPHEAVQATATPSTQAERGFLGQSPISSQLLLAPGESQVQFLLAPAAETSQLYLPPAADVKLFLPPARSATTASVTPSAESGAIDPGVSVASSSDSNLQALTVNSINLLRSSPNPAATQPSLAENFGQVLARSSQAPVSLRDDLALTSATTQSSPTQTATSAPSRAATPSRSSVAQSQPRALPPSTLPASPVQRSTRPNLTRTVADTVRPEPRPVVAANPAPGASAPTRQLEARVLPESDPVTPSNTLSDRPREATQAKVGESGEEVATTSPTAALDPTLPVVETSPEPIANVPVGTTATALSVEEGTESGLNLNQWLWAMIGSGVALFLGLVLWLRQILKPPVQADEIDWANLPRSRKRISSLTAETADSPKMDNPDASPALALVGRSDVSTVDAPATDPSPIAEPTTTHQPYGGNQVVPLASKHRHDRSVNARRFLTELDQDQDDRPSKKHQAKAKTDKTPSTRSSVGLGKPEAQAWIGGRSNDLGLWITVAMIGLVGLGAWLLQFYGLGS